MRVPVCVRACVRTCGCVGAGGRVLTMSASFSPPFPFLLYSAIALLLQLHGALSALVHDSGRYTYCFRYVYYSFLLDFTCT